MKQFNELTLAQQALAVNYALKEIGRCVEMGLIKFDKEPSKQTLEGYALCAAEDAWYSEREDKVIADIADGK